MPTALDSLTPAEQAAFDEGRAEGPITNAEIARDGPASRASQRRRAAEEPAPVMPEPEPEAEAPALEVAEPEHEARAEAEPEPPEHADEEHPQRTVPHQALHQERERRRKAEQDAQALREAHAAERARMDERLQILTGALQPQPAAPAAPPEFAQDPAGYIQHLSRRVEQAEGQQRQLAEAELNRAHTAEMVNWAARQEQAFVQEQPDYFQAAKHVGDAYRGMLAAMGITDPVQQQQAVAAQMQYVVQKARGDNANVAKRVYEMARAAGYRRAAPVAAGLNDAMAQDPGSQRLATAQRGQAMSASIGTTGSAPRTGRMTAERLASMSDTEFAKMTEDLKHNPAMRDLFGR